MTKKPDTVMRPVFILAVLLYSLTGLTYGQLLDTSFRPAIGSRTGASQAIRRADGKLVVTGPFRTIGGVHRNFIAVLNSDETIDTSFDAGIITRDISSDPAISHVATQADSKVIIAGSFVFFNGVSRPQMARLNVDGSLDTTFNIGTGPNVPIQAFKILPDGKMLVCGNFTTFNGQPTPPLVRLNADGSLDQTFTAMLNIFPPSPLVYNLAVQPDGKIIVTGEIFSIPAGEPRGIVRLNPNGSVDNTFDLGGAPNAFITKIALQADGKVLVSGQFDMIAGQSRFGTARLNTNGSVDTGYTGNVYTGGGIGEPVNFTVQDDGRIVVTGNFSQVNGVGKRKIARLNTDGSLDTSLSTLFDNDDSDAVIGPALLLSDQRFLVAGSFSMVNQLNRYGLAKLNSDGTTDSAFERNAGGIVSINELLLQADGKVLAAGAFNHFNGSMANGLARYSAGGSLDPLFMTGTGLLFTTPGVLESGFANALAVQSDGKILVGGAFASYNNQTRSGLVRINADGTLDGGWPNVALTDAVNDVVVQPDGKILVAHSTSPAIRRYNPAGTLDTGFNAGGSGASLVRNILLLPNGKILVCGAFTTFNGTPRNRIARLNSDGSLDAGFNTSGGPNNNAVSSMAVQPDGKVVIAGSFTMVSSVSRNRVARVNDDGSLDNTFDPGTGADATINKVLLRPNGKVLIGGNFNTFNGTARKRLAQLSSAGSLDPAFGAGVDWQGPGNIGASIGSLLIAGPNLYVGGVYHGINNQNFSSLARLRLAGSLFDYDGDGKADISVFRPSEGNWYIQNSGDGSVTGLHFGQLNDLTAPGDFDGDGKADISVYRPSEGNWYRLNSSDGSFFGTHFGATEDKPAVGDFDGDGKDDISVFRPSEGNWYRLNSDDGSFFGTHFGAAEDKPAVGDFDGDGKADISVFRPSEGNWYRLNSGDGSFFGTHFGIAEDKPTPADYDGDGKTDISVFRPSAGDWFRLNSNDGSFFGTHFGILEDKPAAADFDGDGKADIAVFRPSEGNWYILNSTTGFLSQHFGATEDVPTPNSFVY